LLSIVIVKQTVKVQNFLLKHGIKEKYLILIVQNIKSMALIKSISGIRGTIGGKTGDNLTPFDLVKFTSAYAAWLRKNSDKKTLCVIVGRDARISGPMVYQLVSGTLMGMGIDVINIGLATTPTTEIAVTEHKADGGLILTASHNPAQWNALKMLNHLGEFLNDKEGREVLSMAEKGEMEFAAVDKIGSITKDKKIHDQHIKMILKLPYVNVKSIKKADFKVAIDCVNSVGGTIIPKLLKSLGVKKVFELYCTPDGNFPHNPEPLPEHLKDISALVVKKKADLGFVVDPDVDRLAIVSEDGSMFGEEYTLVAVSDYILKRKKGNTVSNLSSSRALKDVTEKHGGKYSASAVGEVNVVTAMKETKAVIGGEGNGGVILPDLHYGRDALVGIALFLSHLAEMKMKCSKLKATYPAYTISKNKIQMTPQINVDDVLQKVKNKYSHQQINSSDGIRIDFEKEKEWVHLRKSNTEPIIRIYAESTSAINADKLAKKIIADIQEIVK
jgi:phosphomannomutase